MKKLLFVCLGNICRSPMAEAIFLKRLDEEGFSADIRIDSAGTSAAHSGEYADSRMRQHAKLRGYELVTKSRRLSEDDILHFDYIIGMDDSNIEDIKKLDHCGDLGIKLMKMTDFCKVYKVNGVPDPYYGGDEGFEKVIDILEDACNGLMLRLKDENWLYQLYDSKVS